MSITHLSSATPTARSVHYCQLCWRAITPGETYHRDGLVYDGRAYTWKECEHCTAFVSMARLWELDHDGEGLGHDNIEQFEPRTRTEAVWLNRWLRGWRGRHDGLLYPVPPSTALGVDDPEVRHREPPARRRYQRKPGPKPGR